MRTVRLFAVLLPAMALAIAGCQAPPQPVGPTLGSVPVQTPEQVNRLWDSAEDTLRAYNYEIDRLDRAQGILATYPVTAANFFELWRVQPTPAYYWWEANIQTIQSQAQVFVRPSPSPGSYELEVKVDRYRYSLEERQVDNAAAAMRLYSGATPTTSGQMLTPAESSYWIHLGRDGGMEQTILDAIVKRYEQPAATQPAG
jgi:hypothetical protein